MTTTGQRLWDVLSICDVPVFIVVGPTWSKTIIPSKLLLQFFQGLSIELLLSEHIFLEL